jgi:membrane associated rhomboid family serine protease
MTGDPELHDILSGMSTTSPRRRTGGVGLRPGQLQAFVLLTAMVAVMWLLEVVNTLDANHLDGDGIISRNVGRLWGILTAPFLHASFAHLSSNTVPFVFLGVIIALRGARALALVTAIVIVLGGLGTWLIGPSNIPTIGASGVVFGYAGFLLARGLFNRNVLELLTGGVVAVVWGSALVSSLVPHDGISWQGHLCGGIAGIIAAWLVSNRRRPKNPTPGPTSLPPALTR